MDLYDILACPVCKTPVAKRGQALRCTCCSQEYPIVNGIPIMFPDGRVPIIQHEADLLARTAYDPWVHRVVLQSLLDDQVAVELGCGNMVQDDPCIIRQDVVLTPYVDLVADAHALPFLPGTIDYIFSLAVFEHLAQPFVAAQSVYDALKDGGYTYHECNFVFAYHGYPHHYFNATMQGMEQVFSRFKPLRKGVAPYQMPSFAIDSLVRTYLHHSRAQRFAHGRRLTEELQKLMKQNLMAYDIYFTEEAALNVAAGTYYCGLKQETAASSLLPPVIRELWAGGRALQERYPSANDLTHADNILVWAQTEGRRLHPRLDAYLRDLAPFSKRGAAAPWDRTALRSLPMVEPLFGAVGFDATRPLEALANEAESRWRTALPPATPPTPSPAAANPSGNLRPSLPARAAKTLKEKGLAGFLVHSARYLMYRLGR